MRSIVDTIYQANDSVRVVLSYVPGEAHGLAGHMRDSLRNYVGASPDVAHSDWSVTANLGLESSLIALVVIVVFFAWLIWGPQFLKNAVSRVATSKGFFSFVWLYGFVVYDVGMCTGEYISLLTNAPMAIIYAFKIFLFDSDVSEIHNAFHESWLYSLNFALVHFLAAAISTLFLIKLFGFTIVQRVRLFFESVRFLGKNKSETYVFWGFNETTRLLIESIKEHYADSKDYRIIIIRTNNVKNDPSENSTGIARIFDFLSLPSSDLDKLQNLECLTDGTHINLSTINVGNEDLDIIGSSLKMGSLKRILSKRTADKIHMLFLSDDEKENLHDVSIFLQDTTIKKFAEPGAQRQVIFYCHARYNSIHRVIEDQPLAENIKVRVIDSSHDSVELLKTNEQLLPARYVEVEDDATVSTEFNAMVVGFSEVGQDSVRFLYEFGAFVKNGSTDDHAERSKFHLYVVDKQMNELAGAFVANTPAIKPAIPPVDAEDEDSDALITLYNMDCRSVRFINRLKALIKTLNYIVIATNDDELNISLAVRIFRVATRLRKDMDNLCILVRAHNDDDGHIRRIADHYNRIWRAYECAPQVNGKRIHQDTITDKEIVTDPIINIFGLDTETYTYDNIIGNEREMKARGYKLQYEKTVNPGKVFEMSPWDAEYRNVMQLDKPWIGFSPTYFGIMSLRRTQAQDFANSAHEVTKIYLKNQALSKCGLEDYPLSKLSRKECTLEYMCPRTEVLPDEIKRIVMTLAQTEHIRWTASHEILGYQYKEKKDEVRLEHNCLVPWDKLSEEVKSYDNNVSDSILHITIIPNPGSVEK